MNIASPVILITMATGVPPFAGREMTVSATILAPTPAIANVYPAGPATIAQKVRTRLIIIYVYY
jgi:hypothetical protein